MICSSIFYPTTILYPNLHILEVPCIQYWQNIVHKIFPQQDIILILKSNEIYIKSTMEKIPIFYMCIHQTYILSIYPSVLLHVFFHTIFYQIKCSPSCVFEILYHMTKVECLIYTSHNVICSKSYLFSIPNSPSQIGTYN